MAKTTMNINYDVAGGETSFDPFEMEKETAAVQVSFDGLDSDDAKLSLEQSIDNRAWHGISGGDFILPAAGSSSHLFNIANSVRGMMFRLSFYPGSCTAGNILQIIILT